MSAPEPPDAGKTAGKQFDFAKAAADYGMDLSTVNQATPTGSLTYTATTGYDPVTGQQARKGNEPVFKLGKDGTYKEVGNVKRAVKKGRQLYEQGGAPEYTATTTLTPDQQAILDAMEGTAQTSATRAGEIAGAVPAGGPDLSGAGITDRVMGWGREYFQPGFDQDRAGLEAKLTNQGIAPGSEAWTNAMRQMGDQQQRAYTDLLLSGMDTAIGAGRAEYLDPLQAYSTLLTGGQPQGVSLVGTPSAGVQTPDYAGAANQQYQNEASNYQNAMQGLFSIPTAILGGWASGGF